MNYVQALGIPMDKPQIVTIIGSGGKTTIIEEMADQLYQKGKRVLITTSTHIFLPKSSNAITILDPTLLKELKSPYPIMVYAGSSINPMDKLNPLDPSCIEFLHTNGHFDFILIEGDGSRRLPLKAYASYEPVVPPSTHILIAVMGLNALGKPVQDCVHRASLFSTITGKASSDQVDWTDFERLILSPDGYFKSRAPRNFLILNRYRPEMSADIGLLTHSLRRKAPFLESVLIREEL